jgi:O-antigen/teichoic acid export membrane protein
MAGVILPVGATLAVFSREILQIWTRNPVIAERSHVVMSIVIAGTCLNALMNMPYALQLAHGWTRLILVTNVIATLMVVPLVMVGASLYGMVGAASVWVLLNLAYVLVPLQIMHGRLLRQEKSDWYIFAAALPAAIAVAVVLACRVFMPSDLPEVAVLAVMTMTLVLAIAATVLAMPVTREAIHGWITARRFA